ncbi:hypothetical protein niasHS_006939 [Heterodera schachtii]|uniref:Uncharacterized protein n=2 Tax=Heterodera TaxID=34509 RepID=A0ABD2JG04_HETSC
MVNLGVCCCCRKKVIVGEGQTRRKTSAPNGKGRRRRQRDGSRAKLEKFFGILYSPMDDGFGEESNAKELEQCIGETPKTIEPEPMVWMPRDLTSSSSQFLKEKEAETVADLATIPSNLSKCVMEAKGQNRFALRFEDTEYIVDVNSRGADRREGSGGAVQNFRFYRRSNSVAGKAPPSQSLLSSSSTQIRPKMSVVGRVASLFVSDDSSPASSAGGTRKRPSSLLGMIGAGRRASRSVSGFIPTLFQWQKSTETAPESDAGDEERRQQRMVGEAVEK